MGVGVGPDCAQYLPPVLSKKFPSKPPQTIISVPVHTAFDASETSLGLGALATLVAIQAFVVGLYLPPVLKNSFCIEIEPAPNNHFGPSPDSGVSDSAIRRTCKGGWSPAIRRGVDSVRRCLREYHHCIRPRQSSHRWSTRRYDLIVLESLCWLNPAVCRRIISAAGVERSHQTATPNDHFAASPDGGMIDSWIWRVRRAGRCPAIGIWIVSAHQCFAPQGPSPPQTIISVPVQTAVCHLRGSGALVSAGCSPTVSAAGLYLPPVLRSPVVARSPPQTIMSLPVQTAV